jgi:Ca-activated chloride channel homolog
MNRRTACSALAAFGLNGFGLRRLAAQDPDRETRERTVPVLVLDPADRPVTGLSGDDFQVFEDRVEQTDVAFSARKQPISVALVLDASGSRGANLPRAKEAARQFLSMMGPQDETSLITFDSGKPRFLRLTSDVRALLYAVDFIQGPLGQTPLRDAIEMGIERLSAEARHRWKIVLVNSDGGDNASRHASSQVADLAVRAGVQVYAFGELGREELMGGDDTVPYLVKNTGGLQLANNMPEGGRWMMLEIQSRYFLTYNPANWARDGKRRQVRVEVRRPAGAPKWRAIFPQSYYAPL